MNVLRKLVLLLLLSIVIAVPFLSTSAHALSDASPVEITEWEMMWEEEPGLTAKEVENDSKADWIAFAKGDDLPVKPPGISSAWLRIRLPEYDLARPALLISKLTAKDVRIYIDNELVYESKRNYPYNKNEILLSLDDNESTHAVYLHLQTESDWLGIKGEVKTGEYQTLNKGYLKIEMLDVVLGAALLFVSLAMFLCIFFLEKSYLPAWGSLSVVIFAIGVMILTLSPYLHITYNEFGFLIYYMFDIASNLVMPAMFVFIESIFGKGPYGIINRFRKLLVGLSALTIVWLFISFTSELISRYYTMVTIYTFGFSVIVGNGLLFIFLVKSCMQKNKEAIIITSGFSFFAFIGVGEVVWYFIKEMNYNLFFWKWGILGFISALVIILARRILKNYEQVVTYSKQLEVFNNELQRSEKMEIISQLAASVAHEVRNPLQVTRGFLQLLRDKTNNEKDNGFMELAIEELDRASAIITDFLTFAKPQQENMTLLNIAEELQKIEGILVPLANMQGGIINVQLDSDLYVRGNSSKFKQALINIIKNSIEALTDEGMITIQAYLDDNKVTICIKDNGEGMHEADLKRLGEPYYSKKSKGTGLGLMVTFRIIEAMEGKVEFFSVKGVGTEAVIKLPYVTK
ncbi:HAMP domain-containing histidine kinase [Paenibacillus sp. N4]|uniref:sensor histidine kinase n=1 Tax=Paenibacillus vietnamensis TaxID=2590547 RepID=UPI001CD0AFB6|nr:sensor histidine kinase [Paenibacillus vietnamensis]MCA0756645.1 HAMP domain-containing histidine kinase [Paenibacillus vietnamensis]